MWDKKEILFGALGVFLIWMIGLSSMWLNAGQTMQTLSTGAVLQNAIQNQVLSGTPGPFIVEDMDIYIDGGTVMTGYYEGTSFLTTQQSNNALFKAESLGGKDYFLARFNAQQELVWFVPLGNPPPVNHDDFGFSLDVHSNGNIAVVGQYGNVTQSGPTSGGFVNIFSSTGTQIYGITTPLDTAINGLNDVEFLSDGSLIVVGTQMTQSLVFGGLTQNKDASTISSLLLARIDASGNAIWIEGTEGAFVTTTGLDLVVTDDDDVYVTGLYTNVPLFGPDQQNPIQITQSGSVFLAKYDGLTGDLDFARVVPGITTQSGERINDMEVFANGDVMMVGMLPSGAGDVFLGRYDASGNLIWSEVLTQQVATPDASDEAYDVEIFSDEHIMVSGLFGGQLLFGSGNGSQVLEASGTEDGFMAMFDGANGSFIWAEKLTSTGNVRARSIALRDQDTFLVAGQYEIGLDLEPNNAQSTDLTSSSSEVNLFLAEFDLQFALPATQLAFVQQPQDTLLGKNISPEITVQIQDAQGQVVSSAMNQVTLIIKTNPGNATFTPLMVNAIDGVATFSNLMIDQVGEGYVLEASATGLNSSDSDPFSVRHLPILSTLYQTLTQSGGNVAVRGMDSLPDGTTAITGNFGGNETIFGNGIPTTPTNNVTFFVALFDSNHDLEWVRLSDQGGINNLGFDVSLHTDKTVFVSGHFNSSMRLGQDANNPIILSVPGSSASFHGFLAKYLENGDLDWAMPVTSSSAGVGTDVEVLSDGSVLLLKDELSTSVVSSLERYSSNSQLLWSVLLNNPTNSLGRGSLSVFSDDSFVIALPYLDLSFIDTSAVDVSYVSQTSQKAALIKFTKDGTHVWNRTDGGGQEVLPEDVFTFPDGSSVVVGTGNGLADFGNTSIDLKGGYLAKYDFNGSFVSVQNLADSGTFSYLNVESLYDDDVLVVGAYQTTSAVFSSSLVLSTELLQSNGSQRELFLAHFRGDLELDWVKRVASSRESLVVGLEKITGGFVIAGDMLGDAVFDENESTAQTLDASVSSEGYIARYSLNGAPISPATHLQVVQDPLLALAEKPLDPPIIVEIRDAQNQLVSTANNEVTLSFRLNPHGATTGPFTATAVNGVATFSNVVVDKVGDGYQFEANATGLSSANARVFNVYVTDMLNVNVSDAGTTNGVVFIPHQTLTKPDGSYFVSGRFTGIARIPTPPNFIVLSSSGVSSSFVVGYGADHSVLFAVPYDQTTVSPRMDTLQNGDLLLSGGYVLGTGKSAFRISKVEVSTGVRSIFTQVAPSGEMIAADLSVYPDDSFVVTGRLQGSFTTGSVSLTSVENIPSIVAEGNAYAFRFSSTAQAMNAINIGGGAAVSEGLQIETVSDGGYVLLGRYVGSLQMGLDTYTSDTSTYDGFLARYNAQDQLVWSKNVPLFNSQGDITLLSDESVVLFSRQDTFTGRLTRFRFDTGEDLWSQVVGDFDGEYSSFIHAVTTLSDDSILGLVKSNGRISFTDPIIKSELGIGPVLFRYDKNGVFAWSKMELGSEFVDVDAFSNDDFALTGQFSNPLQVTLNNSQVGQTLLSSTDPGDVEFFVAKYRLSLKNRDPEPLRLAFLGGTPSGSRNFPLNNVSVTVLDELNRAVQNQNFPISMGFETHPIGASLSGTTQVTSVLGTAVFSDLQVNTVGTYQLRATSVGLNDGLSAGFIVQNALPTPTNFVMNGSVGAINASNVLNSFFTLDSAVVADLHYTFLGPVSQIPRPSMSSNPAVIVGTNTFSNFDFTGFDDGQIQVSFDLLDNNGANSQQLVLNVLKDTDIDAPTNIVVNNGNPITPNNADDIDVSFEVFEAGEVTISLHNIYRGGLEFTASCMISVPAPGASVCEASDLSSFRFDTDSQLRTTVQIIDVAGNSVSSQAIEQDLLPQQASTLRFVQQPTDILRGAFFSPDVSVELLDQGGARIDTNADVMIAIAPSAGVAFGGSHTVAAMNGLATFPDLSVNPAGTYTLLASSSGVQDVISDSFGVVEAPLAPSNLRVNDPLNGINASNAGDTSFSVDVNVDGVLHYVIGDGVQFTSGMKNVTAGTATVSMLNLSTFDDGKINFDLFLQGETGVLSDDSLNERDKDTDAEEPTNLLFNGGDVYNFSSLTAPTSAFSFDASETGTITYTIRDENAHEVSGSANITQSGPQNISFSNFRQFLNNQFVSELDDGNLTLTMNFTDAFGNMADPVEDTELKDTVAHRASQIYINDGSGNLDRGEVNVSNVLTTRLFIEGLSEIATLDYIVRDAFGGEVPGSIQIAQVQAITEISPLNLSDLQDGNLVVQLSHRDQYGNTNFDLTGPQFKKDTVIFPVRNLNFEPISGGNINNATQSDIKIEFDADELGKVEYEFLDEVGGRLVGTIFITQLGFQSNSPFDLNSLGDGEIILNTVFIDNVGNRSTIERDSAQMDRVAEPLTDVRVNGNAPINASRLTNFSITYTAAELGNTSIRVEELNNPQNSVTIDDPVTNLPPQSILGDVSSLQDDILVFRFTFTDTFGNTFDAAPISIRKDATIGDITNIRVNNGSVVNEAGKTSIPLVFDAPEAGLAKIFFSDGTTEFSQHITVGPLAPNTALTPFPDQSQQVTFSSLQDGTISTRFEFDDHAGNRSQGPGPTVMMDTQVEMASNIVVNGGNIINSSQQGSVSVSYEVAESGTTQVIVSDGVDQVQGQLQTGGILNRSEVLDLSPLQDGTLNVSVNFTDEAGNVAMTAVSHVTVRKQTQVNGVTGSFDFNGGSIVNKAGETSVFINFDVSVLGTADYTIRGGGQEITGQYMIPNVAFTNPPGQPLPDITLIENIDVSALRDGELTAELTFTDEVGNNADLGIQNIQKDTIVNAPTGFQINNGQRLYHSSRASVQMSFAIDEPGSISYRVIQGAARVESGASFNNPGNVGFQGINLTSFSAGTFQFEMDFEDLAGNVSSLPVQSLRLELLGGLDPRRRNNQVVSTQPVVSPSGGGGGGSASQNPKEEEDRKDLEDLEDLEDRKEGEGGFFDFLLGGMVQEDREDLQDRDDREERGNESFSDVKEDDEGFREIQRLKELGVVQGINNSNVFAPSRFIDRAQILKILMRLMSYEEPETVVQRPFVDIPTREWYSPFVWIGKQLGFIDGYPDGSFKPAQLVNKAEAMKMMYRVLGIRPALVQESMFADIPDNEWHLPYFADAYQKGILEVNEFGSTRYVDPAEIVDRRWFAQMVVRLWESNDELTAEELDIQEVVFEQS